MKPAETDGDQEQLFARMAAAVAALPDVMVEMPVIPGTLDEMKRLLRTLDNLGVRGINLLEFCFPLCNAEEFLARGFMLRQRPYEVLYNYWYAGGLPIAGSETESLELLRFAADEGLRLGVHYCSLDNKHSGQVFQQNKPFLLDRRFAAEHAWLSMDERDYFLKCGKVFGEDAEALHAWAQDRAEGESAYDEDVPCLAFPLAWASAAREARPGATIGVSFNVLEPTDDGAPYLREVDLREEGRA